MMFQTNVYVSTTINISRIDLNSWGWAVTAQVDNGNCQTVGVYTDPCKMIVDLAKYLFHYPNPYYEPAVTFSETTTAMPSRMMQGKPVSDEEYIRRSARFVVPEVQISVMSPDEEKISWSTIEERDLQQKRKEAKEMIKEIAK